MQKEEKIIPSPPSVSPKIDEMLRAKSCFRTQLLRQVTGYDNLIGCPAADAKIRENNQINKVRPGDEGYLPLSYETGPNYFRSFSK
jgi:hypothetical protein